MQLGLLSLGKAQAKDFLRAIYSAGLNLRAPLVGNALGEIVAILILSALMFIGQRIFSDMDKWVCLTPHYFVIL